MDFILEVILPILLVVALLIGVGVGLGYVFAAKSVNIYNQQNGTNWTAWDFFWASDQINSQTQTINLNQINK